MGRRRLLGLLERHGLTPSRALGQNFLVDPNTAERIVRLAGVGPGDRVVEVGGGVGSLTGPLAATGAEVTVVELDRRAAQVLRDELAGVRVVEGDAMALDWAGLLDGGRWQLVANLPYNIATPLVLDLLDGVPAIERMLVMVQREVADRLAAGAGSPAYGAPSVKLAYWAEARVVGRVPATVFVPRPKVESALLEVVRRPDPAVDPALVPHARFVAVVNAGFAHRRKMLRGALAGVVGPAGFAAAGVDPAARAGELDVAAWGRLAAQAHRPAPAG
ncbi:MAG TPA: 16S rRNA (adenine(1518)-N(6)/adenine(1519)-N(6))-dimethyltransferase RsmA [Acidimicrobiales bacterium]|nr:16S rRNA (adenine(1518)-N(6)/adenine(1519)-N(6))-dimethyltransferase RsmA [Acidimicrobiales bacterium]